MARSPTIRRQDEAPLTPPESKAERELHAGQRESFSLNRITFGGRHHSEIPQNDPDYYPADAGDRNLFRETNCPPCDCDCMSDGLTGCLRRNKQCLFTVLILSVSTIVILLIFRSLSYDHRGRYVEDSREEMRWESHHHHYNETDDPDAGPIDEGYPHVRVSIPIIEDSREPDYYTYFPHRMSVLKSRQLAQANFLKRRRKRGASEDYNSKNIRDVIIKQKSKYEQVLAELNDIQESMMQYKTRFSDNPRTVFEPFSLTYPTTGSWTESVESPAKLTDGVDKTGNSDMEVVDSTGKWTETVQVIPNGIIHDSVTPGLDNQVNDERKPSFDKEKFIISADSGFKEVGSTTFESQDTERVLGTSYAGHGSADVTTENAVHETHAGTGNTESDQTERYSEVTRPADTPDGDDRNASGGDFVGSSVHQGMDGKTAADLVRNEVLESNTQVSETTDASFTADGRVPAKLPDAEIESVPDQDPERGKGEKAKNFEKVFIQELLPDFISPYDGRLDSFGVHLPEIVPEQRVEDDTVGISLAEAKKKKLQSRKQMLLNSRIVSRPSDISFPTAPDETKSVLGTDESLNTSQQLSLTPSAFAQYFFPYQVCFYENPPHRGKSASRKASPKTFKIEAPSFFHIPSKVDDAKQQTSYHFPTQQNFLSFNINNYANHGQPSSNLPPSAGSTYILPSPQHFAPFFSGAHQPQQQPLFCTYIQPPLLQYPSSFGASEFIQPKCVDCEDDLSVSREVSFPSAKEVACLDNTLSCRDGSKCIPAANWCDNKVHCKDGSDEIYCSCRERLAPDRLCDGYLDCPLGEDEIGCFGCPRSTFSCDTYDEPRACIPISKRCDNFPDCPTGKDEMECTALFPDIGHNNSFHVSYGKGFLHKNWRGEWFPVCVDLYSNSWATIACMEELGPFSGEPHVSFTRVPHTYKGPFIVRTKNEEVLIQDHCKGHVSTYVRCPEVSCGTRIMSEDYVEARFKRYVQSEAGSGRQWWKDLKKEIMAKYQVDDVYWKLKPVEVEVDGKRRKREETGRVVGGKESEPRAWPWIIALYKNGDFHCGGAILDEKWILTAAHCVVNYHKDYYEVRGGMLRRFSYSPMEQVRSVSEVVVHERYNESIMNNDVALLRLNKPLSFNRWVRPACLPGIGEGRSIGPRPGMRCIAIGWGAIQEHGTNPDQMREVEVPILPKCRHMEDVEGGEICAGIAEGGKDTCQGDSGGPLLCRDSKSSWYVAGIVSHGEGCARPGEPGAYTRVSLFMDWITANSNDFQPPIDKPLRRCPGFRCASGTKRCIAQKWVCNGLTDCLHGEDEVNCKNVELALGRSMEDKILTGTLQEGKDPNSFLLDEESLEKKNGTSQTPVVRNLKRLAGVKSYMFKAVEVYGNLDYLNKSGSAEDFHGTETGADEKLAEDKTEIKITTEALPPTEEVNKHESSTKEVPLKLSKESNDDTGHEKRYQLKWDEDASNGGVHILTEGRTKAEKPGEKKSHVEKEDGQVNREDHSDSVRGETEETDGESYHGDRESEEFAGNENNSVGYVRSYSPRSSYLPSMFQCRNIIQSVKWSYHCDGIRDCEDGSDEIFCSCEDKLMKAKPELVCNGVSNCDDLTDERHCHSCSRKEFNCLRSRQCLPNFKRCDDVKDCTFGEDEEGCFALAKNGKIRLGRDRKPLLRLSGIVMSNKGNVWSPFCQDNNALKTAVRACSSFGSNGYDKYENGTILAPNCTTLDLTCSRRLSNDLSHYRSYERGHSWPWLAFVYSDGKKFCTAALLEREWLMTGVHCAEHMSLRRNHVVAKLGSEGEDLDDIHEFGTQIIRVDGVSRIQNTEIILLHLNKPVNVTWRVRPLSLPFWFDASSGKDICAALGEETIFFRSFTVGGSFRSFTKLDDPDRCQITHRHKPWTGVIACQSQLGWYPASVFHERKGFCSSERFYYLNILERAKEIKSAIERGVDPAPELKCDGMRCREGRCVPGEKICDGIVDCLAGEDESFEVCFGENHKRKGCRVNEITCKNGACVAKNLFGNGEDDCGDGSDEPEQFTCREYLKLTLPERVCDGIVNCYDKSDERPDLCNCSQNHFNCSLSQTACVPLDFVCDGAKDCPRGEDEAECVGYKRLDHGSNKKEIEIIHMSYGVWHSLCSPSISESQANEICRELGYQIALDVYKKNQTRISPAMDPFTAVKLNARTSVLLRGDRPFARAEENGHCEVVRVLCH